MSLLTAVAVAGAFATSWATVRALRALAPRLGLLDRPNARSSHHTPKPRGGGLGVLAGTAAGVSLLAFAGGVPRDAVVLLACSLPVAAVGWWDDLRGLPAWPRLLVHTAAAFALASTAGALPRLPLPPPADVALGALALPATVLWLVAVSNFFNFMDGIDGLAGGQAVVSLALVAALAWSDAAVALALPLTAATLGFLVHNWAPARIFLGDVGSGWLGFLVAGLPLLADEAGRPRAVTAAATALALFLLDPVVALLVRWRRGSRLGEAHRDHAYQRLARAAGSHGRVAAGLVAAAAGLAWLGWAGYGRPAVAWLGLAAAAVAFAGEVAAVRWSPLPPAPGGKVRST